MPSSFFFLKEIKNFKLVLVTQRNSISWQSPLIVNFHSHEKFKIRGQKIACIVCELIEGEILGELIEKQRQKKMSIFAGIHLLYSLVCGLEFIHLNGEYHGDLHVDNIIIKKFGLEFEIKIIDFHHWGDSKKDNRDEDIIKTIRIFYDILGGSKHYKNLPPSIKYIICGLKRGLILDRFKTVSHLRFTLNKWIGQMLSKNIILTGDSEDHYKLIEIENYKFGYFRLKNKTKSSTKTHSLLVRRETLYFLPSLTEPAAILKELKPPRWRLRPIRISSIVADVLD